MGCQISSSGLACGHAVRHVLPSVIPSVTVVCVNIELPEQLVHTGIAVIGAPATIASAGKPAQHSSACTGTDINIKNKIVR